MQPHGNIFPRKQTLITMGVILRVCRQPYLSLTGISAEERGLLLAIICLWCLILIKGHQDMMRR